MQVVMFEIGITIFEAEICHSKNLETILSSVKCEASGGGKNVSKVTGVREGRKR